MARPDTSLTSAQLRSLRQMVESQRTPPYLARRAAFVLDEHHARKTGAARAASVSRQTAAKWLRRYAQHGIAGLEDAARSGRPTVPRAIDDTVLVAPLYVGSANWTSRTVAAHAGCSQSAVARIWKRTYEVGGTRLGASIPAVGLRLVGCHIGATASILLFETGDEVGADVATSPSVFMRSPLRRPLQTLLAADLVATRRLEDTRHPMDLDLARDGADLALCTSENAAAELRAHEPKVRAEVVDRSQWQGLLVDLGVRLDPTCRQALTTVQHRAMDWARSPDSPFTWIDVAASREPRGPIAATAPIATSEHVADSIVTALQREILAGRLGGGDRVTESYLANAVHASRGYVRDALRVLASRGIVELEPNRGAVIPRPTIEDVVETYAARRALGALIVRRAAETAQPGHIDQVTEALDVMLETAKSGDAWATGEEDFRFQETLALTTGMRRVPAMFSILTAQLRIFVAVLGLRYAYSIPDMCHDNEELLRSIARHDADDAVRRWNSKINEAATYMMRQLEPGHIYRAAGSAR